MGRSRNHHDRLKGTTMVETLTALTLIVIAFGIGAMIYSDSLVSNPVLGESVAYPLLQSAMENAVNEGDFTDKSDELEGLLIHREIIPYPNFDDVYEIRLSAELDDREIMTIRKLIHIEK